MTSYAIKRTRRHACGGKWKLLLPAAALLLLGAALFLLSRPALLHSPEGVAKAELCSASFPFLPQAFPRTVFNGARPAPVSP